MLLLLRCLFEPTSLSSSWSWSSANDDSAWRVWPWYEGVGCYTAPQPNTPQFGNTIVDRMNKIGVINMHAFDAPRCTLTKMYVCCSLSDDYLPRAANEMNACACFRILSGFTSGHFLFWMGNRMSSNSRKSSGVTDEMSHFSRLSTHNSQCWYRNELEWGGVWYGAISKLVICVFVCFCRRNGCMQQHIIAVSSLPAYYAKHTLPSDGFLWPNVTCFYYMEWC